MSYEETRKVMLALARAYGWKWLARMIGVPKGTAHSMATGLMQPRRDAVQAVIGWLQRSERYL